MVNFETDKLIIVCYPRNTGGKFLINALGLSDRAIFQSDALAEKQLAGAFTHADKIQYLNEKLDEVKDRWTDLDMGCYQFFGFTSPVYKNTSVNEMVFNPIVETITNDERYNFFMVSHECYALQKQIQVWKNAKLIIFENFSPFISHYRPEGNALQWDNDKEKVWMGQITAVKEPMFYWNTNWYFSKEDTLAGIKELYTLLGFSDFNQESISRYYEQWINTLSRLRSIHEDCA